MGKMEIQVNMQVLEYSLEKLNVLKQKSFDTSKIVLSVSKGKAVTSQERVLQAFEKIDEDFTLLIDESINFLSQAKQGYIVFDEEYAKAFRVRRENIEWGNTRLF